MMLLMCEEEERWLWRGGEGWTWTLAVILLIFTCTTSRFFFFFFLFFFRRSSSSSLSSTTTNPNNNTNTTTTTTTTHDADAAAAAAALPSLRTQTQTPTPGGGIIICDLDLKNLIKELDDENTSMSSTIIWEDVIHKTSNSISYKAKCCKPKDAAGGPLKYLSVTTFEDCSVDLLFNFYMDNTYRMQWDKTVVLHQHLQLHHHSATEIGRTIKKFPFLTPRDYVLAWRLWQGIDGSFYCYSKECGHHLVPIEKRYVRVAVFRSGWRIRKVPGRNACEIRMVHQEDAGLNVEMAKVAFVKGIWSYVRKMDDALRRYPAGRQYQPNSTVGFSIIRKVPPEFEATNDEISTVHPENSTTTVNDHIGTCRSKMKKLTRWPSNKFVANGLVLLGGAICLSRGNSSLGTKVAMAYLLSKLTKHGASSKKEGKLPCNNVLSLR